MKKEVANKKKTTGSRSAGAQPVKKAAGKAVKKAASAVNIKTNNNNKTNRKGVIDKVQELIDENEETIHLVLEIAALTIQKSKISPKNKKIVRAALALIAEITSPEGVEVDKEFPILMHNN
jgi:hypothetical protein